MRSQVNQYRQKRRNPRNEPWAITRLKKWKKRENQQGRNETGREGPVMKEKNQESG